MTKAELRALYKTRRQQLSAAETATASQQVCRQWQEYMNADDSFNRKDWSADTAISVHVFLPIYSQNEVDTWLLINWLWQTQPTVQVVTSIADFGTGKLKHVVLTPQTELIINHYGIPEPNLIGSTVVLATSIDIVLVPLLIFDERGHRVGYGKGFYDRFLAECRPDCVKIGLSIFDPVDCIDDVTETDVVLNACITPKQVWHFL